MTTLLNANNKWYELYIYMYIMYIYICIYTYYTYISWSTHIGRIVRICQKALNKMATSCAK